MRIGRDERPAGPIVTGFVAGGFKVEDAVHRALLLTPEHARDWAPPPLGDLDMAALAPVLAIDPAPEFLLLGTGDRLIRPASALLRALEARAIGVEPMDSRAAARAWGVLRGEGRWIAGALYPLS